MTRYDYSKVPRELLETLAEVSRSETSYANWSKVVDAVHEVARVRTVSEIDTEICELLRANLVGDYNGSLWEGSGSVGERIRNLVKESRDASIT